MKSIKRILAVVLSCMLLMTGCGLTQHDISETVTSISTVISSETTNVETVPEETVSETSVSKENIDEESDSLTYSNNVPDFSDLSDESLLAYVADNIYSGIVDKLNSGNYFVEEVSAVYVSKEYLEELEYNSKSNIFFGYTLEEVESTFSDGRFVFTLGDDGTTVMKPFEGYDDTYEKVIKNVAIGTGVILICVTVSVVSGGAAPAVNMIFAASAKTATTFALSSGAISGVASGIIKGIETNDFDEAMKAAAIDGSEAFKWGAITGAVAGGASETIGLKKATLSGLKINEAAKLQKECKWPLEVIKSIHSMDEAQIYKKAGLEVIELGGKKALVQKVDWDLIDEFGKTNKERVLLNKAPIGPDGKPFELHHVGQKTDTPLAILTNSEHHAKENFKILHYAEEGKDITDEAFKKVRDKFWLDYLEYVGV